MPHTVPAAAIGLPNLNRRSALTRLGLGIAASTSVATASAIAAPPQSAISPELLRLIEAHRVAYAHFEDILIREPEEKDCGFERWQRDEARADATEEEAMMALRAYRCSTLGEARMKAAYVLTSLTVMETTQTDYMEALLQSFCERRPSHV